MQTWSVERDGIFFILSDEDISTGDYFVFLKPDDRNVVLFNTESLKYSGVSAAKVLFHYDKNKRPLTELIDGNILQKTIKFNF